MSNQFVKSEFQQADDKSLNALHDALPMLSSIMEELPKSVWEGASGVMLQRVQLAWQSFKDNVAGRSLVQSDFMAKLLGEACITWPFESMLLACKEEWAGMESQRAGGEKRRAFVNGMLRLVKVLEQEGYEDELNKAKALALSAEGVSVDGEDEASLKSAWNHLSSAMETWIASSFAKAQVVLDFLLAFQKVFDKEVVVASVKEMKAAIACRSSLEALERGGPSVSEQLDGKQGKDRLRCLVSSAEALRPFISEATWACETKGVFLELADGRIKEAQEHWLQTSQLELQKSGDVLSHLKHGSGTNLPWTHGLAQDAAWTEVMEHAKKSIKLQSGEELPSAMSAVQQVHTC